MTAGPKPQALRDAISDALYETKAYTLPARCQALGLDATLGREEEDEAHASKKTYVNKRLAALGLSALLEVAGKILEEQDDDVLEALVAQAGARGVQGELQNLIFASLAKPQIVLRDATRNVIEITRHADKVLIYDQPLGAEGLTWRQLVQWWRIKHGAQGSEDDAGRALWSRLVHSLDEGPERLLLHTYSTRYRQDRDAPALLPQVWLHYDPFLRRGDGPRPLTVDRQRMDLGLLQG